MGRQEWIRNFKTMLLNAKLKYPPGTRVLYGDPFSGAVCYGARLKALGVEIFGAGGDLSPQMMHSINADEWGGDVTHPGHRPHPQPLIDYMREKLWEPVMGLMAPFGEL